MGQEAEADDGAARSYTRAAQRRMRTLLGALIEVSRFERQGQGGVIRVRLEDGSIRAE